MFTRKYFYIFILFLFFFPACQSRSNKDLSPAPQEEAATEDIKDIKPIVEIKRDWKRTIIFWGILILAGIIIYLIIRKYRSRKKPSVVTKLLPAHELALKELNELKDKWLLREGKIKPYYFELSEIFRRYLALRYNFPAEDWTSEEIMQHLKNQAPEEIGIFLTNTDKVKFAKYLPFSDEPEREFNRAVEIIEKTKLVVTEVDPNLS